MPLEQDSYSLTVGCHHAANPAPLPRAEERVQRRATLARLAQLSDDELAAFDIAALNLWCALGLPGAEDLDVEACLRKLDDWTELVRVNTDHWWPAFLRSPAAYDRSPAQFCMMALVTVLQRDLGVRYHLAFSEGDYDATDSRDLFIHGLLSNHGGTCVSMPILYMAVGRRLGYPLKLVQAREHLFVRWEEPGGERFNIESTSLGFSPRDDEYYRTWPKPISDEEVAQGTFLRNLSPREELGVFLSERGWCLHDHLRLEEALEAFYYAAQLAPKGPGRQAAWAGTTVLRWAMLAAEREARRRGGRHIVLNNLTLPMPPGENTRWAVDLARENLDRIIRVRQQKQAAQARRTVFQQIAATDIPTQSDPTFSCVGENPCTTPR